MASGEGQRITYFSKNAIECPVCQTKFNREDLLSGGGRLVAGDLTDELRRSYEPTVRFGEVYPLVYIVTVCPSCFYAAYPQDFLGLSDEAHVVSKPRRSSESRALALSVMASISPSLGDCRKGSRVTFLR